MSNLEVFTHLRAAQRWRRRGNKQRAIEALWRALKIDPGLLFAHVRLARLLDDPVGRRRHLLEAYRINPQNMQVLSLIAQENTRLTPDEAARLYGQAAPVRETQEAVNISRMATLTCANCHGTMSFDSSRGVVVCAACGYEEAATDLSPGVYKSLRDELSQKLTQTRWIVGERLMHCQNCGAEWTLTAALLVSQCQFCGSRHVIQEDALDSFDEPAGIIPFTTPRVQAEAAIRGQLNRFEERLRGVFDTNRAQQIALNGVYMPFWVFDHALDVRTLEEFDVVVARRTQATDRGDVIRYDIAICAVTSPPSELTQQLGIFDRDTALAYDPDLLATYPAEIYNIDLAAAMLRLRGIIASAFASPYGDVKLFSADLSDAGYKLLLFPIWVATITEKDGDLRLALVNGQSGKVVLGKS